MPTKHSIHISSLLQLISIFKSHNPKSIKHELWQHTWQSQQGITGQQVNLVSSSSLKESTIWDRSQFSLESGGRRPRSASYKVTSLLYLRYLLIFIIRLCWPISTVGFVGFSEDFKGLQITIKKSYTELIIFT